VIKAIIIALIIERISADTVKSVLSITIIDPRKRISIESRPDFSSVHMDGHRPIFNCHFGVSDILMHNWRIKLKSVGGVGESNS